MIGAVDGLTAQLLAGAVVAGALGVAGGLELGGALELGGLTVTVVVVGPASGLLVEHAVNATAAATDAVEITASLVIRSR